MRKIIIALAAACLLSSVSYAGVGGKNKRHKQAVKKEQKAKKADCCPTTCPVSCPKTACVRS